MNQQQYEATRTLWKALWTFVQATLGVGAGVIAIQLPANWAEFVAAWPALALPIAFAIWRAVENYRKNAGQSGGPLWRWPWTRAAKAAGVILVVISMAGCATWRPMVTTEFGEEVDGVKTRFEAMSRGGLFGGRVDTSVHEMRYLMAGDEVEIGVGQEAQGLESAEQVELMRIATQGLIELTPVIVDAILDWAASQVVPALPAQIE